MIAPSTPFVPAGTEHLPAVIETQGSGRARYTRAEGAARCTDEVLFQRYRDLGWAEDFEELVDRYGGELFRYLARYVGDRTLAEDLLQGAFLRIHAKRGLYRDGRPVRRWLYAIVTHLAIDALRRAGRHATVSLDQPAGGRGADSPALLSGLTADGTPDPLDGLEEAERRQWVRDSVGQLPEPHRRVLILAYYRGLKYREIAEALDVPLGTVKSRLHVAIACLRNMAGAACDSETAYRPSRRL